MSIYRRANGWAAKFQRDGRMVWVPGGPWETKTQAREAERRHRELLAARLSEETCESFAKRWLTEWPRRSAGTRELYGRAARRFADHFGSTPLGEVGRLEARAFALTIPHRSAGVLATMYEDARNIGIVEANPFSNLRLRSDATRITCPTLEEFSRLLASCMTLGGYATEFRALLQFTAWSCMRSGEIQALRHCDIEGDRINVRRARRTDGSIGLPKNGQARTIAFIEPARVLDQVPRREGSDLVFHSVRGRPLSHATLQRSWEKVRAAVDLERAAAGRPPVRFHDLRHFGATQLLERGFSHFDVSVQLGHTDNGWLVMQRYGHPSRDAALERLVAGFERDPRETVSQSGSRSLAIGGGRGK